MRAPVPMIFITRFELYARTCKLISADTFGNVLTGSHYGFVLENGSKREISYRAGGETPRNRFAYSANARVGTIDIRIVCRGKSIRPLRPAFAER
jgi:hypothetical protein